MPLIPADEYCFLWINWWVTCLTKSEWAGWMQAFFTVFAVAVTGGIAVSQARARRRDEAARAADGFAAKVALIRFALNGVDRFVEKQRSNERQEKPSAAGHFIGVIQLLKEVQAIRTLDMPTPLSVEWFITVGTGSLKLMQFLEREAPRWLRDDEILTVVSTALLMKRALAVLDQEVERIRASGEHAHAASRIVSRSA